MKSHELAMQQTVSTGSERGSANGVTYTLTLSDAGQTIAARVTPLSQTGTSPGLSEVSNSVAVQPANVALTVSPGLKQLRFSWAAVPGASFYKVSYSPAEGAGFVPVSTASSNITTTTYDWDISVHRINWPKAQFLLEACDASNFCLPSANVSAVSVMLGTIGYFKASNTGGGDWFGISVALSGDGLTLAVGANQEDSSSTGINSVPNELAGNAGAVYVYTRTSTGWVQQAYVKASNTEAGDLFGSSVTLSSDGSTLAVGAWQEGGANTGAIPGAPNNVETGNGALRSGAVYIYIRSVTTWTQQAYVKASNTGAHDLFGSSVALSGDGNTLAVGAMGEASANIGVIPGAPNEATTGNSAVESGAVYVYTRSASTWSQQAYVKASNTGAYDWFGDEIALSADGNTLAVGAFGESSKNTGVISGSPGELVTGNDFYSSGAVYVYVRSGTTWSQQAYVKASNTGAGDAFGSAIALSTDGNTLAVGAFAESGSGAVYVYTRSTTLWFQQAYLKGSNTEAGDRFGLAVALSSNGDTLAISARTEDSATFGVITGIPNEASTLNGTSESGAVYVFIRSATIWAQQAYVKASNTGINDNFGHVVALSADGSTLAVGAFGEASAATGVNNSLPGQGDNTAPSAGAVYLY